MRMIFRYVENKWIFNNKIIRQDSWGGHGVVWFKFTLQWYKAAKTFDNRTCHWTMKRSIEPSHHVRFRTNNHRTLAPEKTAMYWKTKNILLHSQVSKRSRQQIDMLNYYISCGMRGKIYIHPEQSLASSMIIFGWKNTDSRTVQSHCGLVESTRTWDGKDCEFESWQCRIHNNNKNELL